MRYKIKYFIIVGFIFATQNIYSQYLPHWLEMGMTKEEIEKKIDTQLYNRKDDLFIYADLDISVIYQFNIRKVNGLTSYWVMGKYLSLNIIVDDFNEMYGDATFINNMYWWSENYKLPLNIKAITVYNKNDTVYICYFFKNSLD
jgi:hypothetical protein